MWRCSAGRFAGAQRLVPALLLATIVAGCGHSAPSPRSVRGTRRTGPASATTDGPAGGTATPTPAARPEDAADSTPGDTASGGAGSGGAGSGDIALARRAILRIVSEYVRSSNSGDVTALVRLYTDDALVLPPTQPPIEGRRRITAFWRHGLDSGLALTPLRIDVHGDVAYVIGRYTLPATDEEPADTGKTVFCLRRLADGSWRLAADMWNTDAGGDDPADALGDDADDRTFTPVT